MKRVAYLGLYKLSENDYYDCSMAAINKMNYIISLLNECGYGVDIYSFAQSKNGLFHKNKTYKLSNKNIYRHMPTIGGGGLFRSFAIITMWLWIWKTLWTYRNRLLLVYHTTAFITPINIYRRFFRTNFILEVEEIYSLMPNTTYPYKKEIKYINKCRKILFVSDLLKEQISIQGCAIYGNYNPLNLPQKTENKSKIILLFSGTIDHIRGAYNAVDVTRFLSKNYKLIISGSGTVNDVNLLKRSIQEINTLKGYEACKYVGILPYKEYMQLLANTDIALNTQIEGSYGKFLFPSKIIEYLRAGLLVVSTPGESITTSPFVPVINISSTFSAEAVAEKIMSLKIETNIQALNLLKNMHDKACKDLYLLLNS